MKERLLQLLDLEHLSPSKFADLIGVQRSSISHVLSGRNKPSFDFLQKTLKAFPGLKADWLMLGEGTMYEHMGRGSAELFGPAEEDTVLSADPDVRQERVPTAGIVENKEAGTTALQKGHSDFVVDQPKDRKVVQVMIFYDDDTFATYKPEQ